MMEHTEHTSGDLTVAQYLAVSGISIRPLDRDSAAKLGIAAQSPAGWEPAPAEQFPGATEVLIEHNLVENGFAPNAVLLVGRLSAAIDSKALLDCSFADARAMPGWTEAEASSGDLGRWPARFLRGTFSAEQLDLAVTTRYAVVGEREQHLVQLTVTILAAHADKLAFDVAVINDGLLRSGI